MNDTHAEAGLTTAQAAKYVGCSSSWLCRERRNNQGPTYYRVGERLIRYTKASLDAWIARNSNGQQQDHRASVLSSTSGFMRSGRNAGRRLL